MRNLKVFIVALYLILLAGGLSSCRPQLESGAPVGMIFDTSRVQDLDHIQKMSKVNGARVMFWNVGWGHDNNNNELDTNLQEIVGSYARPDLLFLAEYKSEVLTEATKNILDHHYPFQAFLKYDPASIIGIKVFCTQKFSVKNNEMLAWSPPGYPNSAKEDYLKEWKDHTPHEVRFWDRSYNIVTLQLKGKEYNIVPLHLLEPWLAYNIRYGNLGVIKSFLVGGNNPLRHQIINLREKLKRDFGNDMNSAPLLVIGDLNTPDSFKGIPSKLYREMSDGLKNIMPGSPYNDVTFPSQSSDAVKSSPFDKISVAIDHALVNSKLTWGGRAVLHLKGSDHYAIYLVIQDN